MKILKSAIIILFYIIQYHRYVTFLLSYPKRRSITVDHLIRANFHIDFPFHIKFVKQNKMDARDTRVEKSRRRRDYLEIISVEIVAAWRPSECNPVRPTSQRPRETELTSRLSFPEPLLDFRRRHRRGTCRPISVPVTNRSIFTRRRIFET